MNWGAYVGLFGIATIKFMFASIPGPSLKLNFIETYFSICTGAMVSSAFFFFSANYFMQRAQAKRLAKNKALILAGQPIQQKKSMTRMNKFIVRMKRSIGVIGISFWAPFFLSIPIGSIVAAKFYACAKSN